jgi:hypothetical protein
MRSGTVRAAVLAVAILPVAAVVTAACGGGSARVERLPPQTAVPATDPGARDALVALVAAGARATWRVDSAFVRTAAGRTLRAQLVEVNRPPDHVVVGLGGATGTFRGRDLTCSSSAGGALCHGGGDAGRTPAVTDAAALAALTAPSIGWYAARAAPDRTIAGLRAWCFTLLWTDRGNAKSWGDRAELCFSRDGVPLAQRVVRGDSTDDTRASSVTRTVTDTQLDALLAPYRDAGPVGPVGPTGPAGTAGTNGTIPR